MAHQLDLSTLELIGDPFPVIDQVGTNNQNSAAGFSVSGNGILAYRTGGGGSASYLVWFDQNGKNLERSGAPVRIRALQYHRTCSGSPLRKRLHRMSGFAT